MSNFYAEKHCEKCNEKTLHAFLDEKSGFLMVCDVCGISEREDRRFQEGKNMTFIDDLQVLASEDFIDVTLQREVRSILAKALLARRDYEKLLGNYTNMLNDCTCSRSGKKE